MLHRRFFIFTALIFLLSLSLVKAGETAQQASKLTKKERRDVIQKIGSMLKTHYVFPKMADKMAGHLNTLLKKKAFKSITHREAFAKRLEKELQAISKDKHVRVRSSPPKKPEQKEPEQKPKEDPLRDRHRRKMKLKEDNYSFKSVKMLDGNVGYLDFRKFWEPELAGKTLAGAMAFLANADAIILDMRANTGGFPPMVLMASSYFFDKPVLLNTLYWRSNNHTQEYWTWDKVDGKKMPEAPLFILTSGKTFSGAEGFCYGLQVQKRATLVGEVTGGGANFGRTFPITEYFRMFIPTGRPINPITKTNWEGTGVKPGIEIEAEKALDKAHELAKKAAAEFRQKQKDAFTKKTEAFNGYLEKIEGFYHNKKFEDGEGWLNWAFQNALDDGILDESMINRLGYTYLEQKKFPLAIAVFTFNTKAFPTSFNTYDSLGEAYMKTGDRENGLKYYIQSIAANPKNETGWKMAKEMLPGLRQGHAAEGTKGFYLKMALQAARWLESVEVEQPVGLAWPRSPEKVFSPYTSLYSYSPGVILFFLETYYATGNRHYLDTACRGADQLLTTIPEKAGEGTYYGLYTGVGGTAFVLQETFRASGKKKYREGVLKCVALIRDNAKKTGAGVDWDEYTDIVGGSAGTGLTLLYLAERLNNPELVTLAEQAGKRLIELGIPEKGGLKWKPYAASKRLMPNFSHGTAGIAYFLATLYKHTHKKKFLDAALAGAKYLLEVAYKENGVCLVFHHEGDGEKLHYLGWCHGPAGTARLFYRLYEVTGETSWMEWVKKSARGILTSGIPEKRTEGFWNNVSRCCGSAGVADFMLDLQGIGNTKKTDHRYLAFAKKLTEDLLRRSTPAGKGLKWVQAEHRVRPKLLQAQTGLMQGSAGIGLWLLRLNAFEKGKRETIHFPDSPF
jgi:predicted negative regulator of RcsB-dependent stress response